MQRMPRYLLFLLSVLVIAALACGGSGGEDPEPTVDSGQTDAVPPTDVPQPTAEPLPTEPPSLAVQSLDAVRSAVIQIVATGSFVDPEFGLQLNSAGSGSGFIIDPSGIAVTNNHVVTGAAFLEVYVAGESSPRNARVLGVSECSDLAVIDIDGDGFPYLEWYDGAINVGLDIYTAGFPLGDPEFTLTRGIISKARTSGETSWASVDNVVEHDATINPGNSGGPLVTADGKVVGVNYAGASSVNQYFAIAREEALPVIDQLRAGSDVNSIGINGTAVTDGATLSGIWVASVESGSPADNAGVEGGDVITSLEGLVLATDGTMSSYCDILRGRNPSDVMAVEVIRFDTQEYLSGQINGDALELDFSFAAAVGDEVTADSGGGDAGGDGTYTYTSITDDSGLLTMDVPQSWTDRNGSQWTSDGDPIGYAVSASYDLDAYNSGWATSGVFFGASYDLVQNFTVDTLLDVFTYTDSCEYDGRYDYSDPLYAGKYDVWFNCGPEQSSFISLSVLPDDGSFIIYVGVQVVTQADLDALDTILNTFVFNG